MSTGVVPAVSPPKQARLGTFAIIERLNPVDAAPGQITLKVAGIPGSSFEGREGIAVCFNAPATDDARAKIEALLNVLKNTAHPSLWPVMDAGVGGSIVYWIRSAPINESLANSHASLSIRETGLLAQSVANGLQIAHSAGLSHGAIRSSAILRFPSGVWTLYGLGIVGRGPGADQFDLASVVVSHLASRPWIEPDLSGYPEGERAYHRAQRMRETLGTTTERVVNVLNKAMHLDPSQRYADISQFGDDLVDQIRISGEDLVHGAFEAISARNVELARIMAEKAGIYNPESENLAILRLQLNGGSVFGSQPVPGIPLMPFHSNNWFHYAGQPSSVSGGARIVSRKYWCKCWG